MKTFSDFKGDDAIDLWADLLEPITKVISDPEVKKVVTSGKSKIIIAKELCKGHKQEVTEILQRIDDTPIDGLNLMIRLIDILEDIGEQPEIKSFFGSAAEEQTEIESSGSPMESTEAEEN